MKKRKILASALALTLALGSVAALAGCKKDDGLYSSTNIQLYYWKSGLGAEFMEETVAAFNASQSEYVVELESDSNAGTIIQTLSLKEDNHYDLYFTMLNTHDYDGDFINLDGVLDSNAYGESGTTIRQKYYSYLLDGISNADGTTNFLNYGNTVGGIVYNADIIDGVKYQVPRTTDELSILSSEITADANAPAAWLFYNDQYNNGYWNYMMYAWAAQYEGISAFNTEIQGLSKTKSDGSQMPIVEKLKEKDGRYKALQALEGIITPSTAHPDSTSDNFTKVQTNFLSGKSAMMINGSWLLKETNLSANVVMMKTPVISSIVEKLEDTAMSDATLSAIVGEIDGGATSSTLCSQKDFDRIKEARGVMVSNATSQYVFIPEYSTAQEGAKAFLRYFYSDEGTAIFMKNTKLPAPVRLNDASKVDISSYPTFNKVQFDYVNDGNFVCDRLTKHEYYKKNNVDIMNGLQYAQLLIAMNPTDKRTAEGLFGIMQTKVDSFITNVQ